MRDKLKKCNKSHFDNVAKKLGILGSIIIVLTIAFGIPLISSLHNQNSILVNDIRVEEKKVSNLQLQHEDGSVTENN